MPSVREEPPANRRLGDFEIVREMGRGGMGVVYEARQASLNRKVALKVLSASVGLTGKAVQRFRREAEAAAKLHHTNIVPIYSTGEENGTHFYAMELIGGPSLDHVIRQLRQPGAGTPPLPAAAEELGRDCTPLASTGPYVENPSPSPLSSGLSASSLNSGSAYFDTVARMVAEVADALDYAHKQGVIHRDVKPSNLLLSPAGRLSVNDFGLARVLEQPGMTVTGEFVGTPAYMSPEQITAGRIPVDHRTDIYSLGATLFELLALRPPFTGSSRDQLLAQIIQKEPPRPRKLNPKAPVDLETICLKCLEKDPDRRYRTAGELAEDLRRYVNRFAILAKRTGPLTKLAKWVKRNPALSGAAAALVLALGAAGYFAWHAYESHQRLRQEQQRAAIDKAMVAAMAADLPTAQVAIVDAEALGASAAELHLLRGFVALYSGDPPAAIKECQAAVEAAPFAVAPRALLSAAYAQIGAYDDSDQALKDAERLTPRTADDRLFLGLALTPFSSMAGLRELRAAQRDRPSKIGQVILADTLWLQATHTGKIADAEVALDAAETAIRLLPRNPFVETIVVNARLAMAAAHDHANEPEKSALQLDAAKRLADNFSGANDQYAVLTARVMLATYCDGLMPPLRETQRLRFPQLTQEPGIAIEVLTRWRLGEIEKARARLAPLKTTYFTAQLQAGLALELEGRAAALQVAWDASMRPDADALMIFCMIPWLYLGGEPERVASLAAHLRATGKQWGRGEDQLAEWELNLRYWEGKLSDVEYLKTAAPERWLLSGRNWIVGMKRLGEGDREGAKDAFTEICQIRSFGHDEWMWARTLLIRMNSDPEWPRAIPMKMKQ